MNMERAVLKAIRDHSMIQEGDSILIGASGGKDSLALSWLLARLAARMTAQGRPSIKLGALKVLIGPDVVEGPYDPPDESLPRIYHEWGIPLRYFGIRAHLDTVNAKADHTPQETVSGCYRCASLRREALARYAGHEGYGSIALGHHLDDLLTTALMNLVIHGYGPVMKPCRSYEKLGLLLIRPLVYVPEESIRRLAARMGWDGVSCTCPAGTSGDRAEFRSRLEVLCGSKLSAKLKLLKGLGVA
jgi:tRNA(Ile)-lysidine synthase TilS/MesJ